MSIDKYKVFVKVINGYEYQTGSNYGVIYRICCGNFKTDRLVML